MLLELFEKYQISNSTLHTNHYRFDLGSLLDKPEQKYELLDILSKDLELARKIGAKRIVIHPYKFPFTKKTNAQKKVVELLVNEIAGISQMLGMLGITAHIENTFDEISFYRVLFEEMKKRSVQNFGFCFDIGHAKIWSSSTLAQWTRLLYDMDDMGFPIHSHLHVNYGIFDDHLPFFDEILSSISQEDEFLEGEYLDCIKNLVDSFPKATFTAEVKSKFALQNMQIINNLWQN